MSGLNPGQSYLRCGICNKEFACPYEGMRKPSTTSGQLWCKPCQDEFDNIDWEEVRHD